MPLPGLSPLYEATYGFFPTLHDCTLVRVESWQDGKESWAQFTVSCYTPEVEAGNNHPDFYQTSFLYVFKLKNYVGALPSTYVCNDIYSFDINRENDLIVGEFGIQPHVMTFKFSATEFVEVSLENINARKDPYLSPKEEMHYGKMNVLVRRNSELSLPDA